MTVSTSQEPMRIKLSEEGRERLASQVERFFVAEFDRELSGFQAQRLIDFFVRNLGAPGAVTREVMILLDTTTGQTGGMRGGKRWEELPRTKP